MRIRFLGSVALSAAIVLGYSLLSGFSYFIPIEILYQFAFWTKAPVQNILTHLVIHTGYLHLLENVSMLLVFALVCEAVLVSVDIIAIFLVSAVVAAGLFGLLNPSVALIGSSAGISGLVASGLLVNPKRALPAIIIAPLLIALVVIPVADGSFFLYKIGFEQEAETVSTELEQAVQRGDVQETERLTQELQQVETKRQEIEVGETFQEETPTDALVHAFGAAAGAGYLFVFRRKKLAHGVEEYGRLLDLVKGKFRPPKPRSPAKPQAQGARQKPPRAQS